MRPRDLPTARSGRAATSSPAASAWCEAQADARGRQVSGNALSVLAGAAGAADAAIVFVLSLLACVARNGLDVPISVVTTAGLASLLMGNALSLAGLYGAHIGDRFLAQVGRAVQAWSIVFVLLLALAYFSKTSSDYSRLWAVGWYGTVVLGLAGVRLAVLVQIRRLRSRGRLATIVAVVDLVVPRAGAEVGGGPALARRLARDDAADTRVLGVFRRDGCGPSGITDLIALSRLFRIDEVLVFVPGEADGTDEISAILRRLGSIPANVRLCPTLPELAQMPVRQTAILHDLPMLTVHRRPLGGWSSLVKRGEDLLIAGALLVVLAPVLAAIAIAIRLDTPGPILFRQARQGFNQNVFTMLKFRSMVHAPAETRAVRQATRHDPRVTAVGRILRRTSLDELPQLFNVLRGDMSLVGPRPHAVVHNEQYSAVIDDYLARHRMQPGITGWAQINGARGETDTLDKMQKRVRFDLVYIDNWSIGLDLKIIALTAIGMLFDRDAY